MKGKSKEKEIKVKCQCKKLSTLFCLDHKKFICDAEKNKHKCKLESTKEYVTRIRSKKAQILNSFISLNRDNNKNFDKFKLVKDKNIKTLHELKNGVVKLFDEIISVYSNKLDMLMDYEFKKRIKEVEEQLHSLESADKYPEIESLIEKNKFATQKARNKEIASNYEDLFETQSLNSDIQESLKIVKTRFSGLVKYLKNLSFDNSDNFRELNKETAAFLSTMFMEENKFATKEKRKPIIMDSVVEENEEEEFDMAYTTSDRELVTNTLLIDTQVGGTFIDNNSNRRGSDLIQTTLFQKNSIMETIEDNNNSSVGDMSLDFDASFDIVDEEEEMMQNEFITEDEIEIDEDVGMENTHQQEIQNKYIKSKEKLNRLLDRVLYDINCPGFFDKQHKSDLNSYVKKFNETQSNIIQELLVNFNKL